MRRERTAIAMSVAEQLWEAERTHDLAMASTARLLATALDARLRLKMAACIGQGAVESLAETIHQQMAGRRSLLQTHDVLNQIKGVAGLAETDMGDARDKEVPRGEAAVLPMRMPQAA